MVAPVKPSNFHCVWNLFGCTSSCPCLPYLPSSLGLPYAGADFFGTDMPMYAAVSFTAQQISSLLSTTSLFLVALHPPVPPLG